MNTQSFSADTGRTPQLQAAFDKGIAAAARGEPESACPYRDERTDRGGVTFSRAFRRAWLHGYRCVRS